MPTFKISEEVRHELERFKDYMRKCEYTDYTAVGYCTCLSRFLRQTGWTQENALKADIVAFLETEKEERPQTFKGCRAAMRLYFEMVNGSGLKDDPKTGCSPAIADLLQRFRVYSLEIKHLEESTVVTEIGCVHKFLEYTIERNPQGFAKGSMAGDIRAYVVEKLAKLSDSSKGRCITSIRNFFRCQVFYGEPVHPSIFLLPLSPAVWSKSAFPVTIDVDAFDALPDIPDLSTDTGKRNRCIILCFTDLALRCSEVASLTLDDFNWHGGHVAIRSAKNKSERILPLSAKLWGALVEYLEQVRPQTPCRTLFVRFSHKRGEPMGRSQIRSVVRRNSARAGLEDRYCGTHILRRTAATKLYNSGNSLKLTADILGHESLDSTTHYAKTDIAGLLSTASPWPGGECNAG